MLGDGDVRDGADSGLFEPFQATEAAEIVGAHQIRRRPLHSSHIQRLWEGVEVAALQHVGNFAVPDAVAVGFGTGVEPGVEPLRRRLHGNDADVSRQIAVQLPQKLRRVEWAGQLHIGHLSQGVYAGIGAAGAVQLHRLTGQAAEHPFHLALNGLVGVSLHLPATVAGAVILNGEFVIVHDLFPPGKSVPETERFGKGILGVF